MVCDLKIFSALWSHSTKTLVLSQFISAQGVHPSVSASTAVVRKMFEVGFLFLFFVAPLTLYIGSVTFSEKSQSSYVDYLVTKILTNKELFTNVGNIRMTSLYHISLTVP